MSEERSSLQIKHADHATDPPSKGKSHDVYYVYTALFLLYVYIYSSILLELSKQVWLMGTNHILQRN